MSAVQSYAFPERCAKHGRALKFGKPCNQCLAEAAADTLRRLGLGVRYLNGTSWEVTAGNARPRIVYGGDLVREAELAGNHEWEGGGAVHTRGEDADG